MIETALGYVFAGLLFTISVIALPLLLDRDVGMAVALLASIRVVAANPAMMTRWGLIVMVLCLAVVVEPRPSDLPSPCLREPRARQKLR